MIKKIEVQLVTPAMIGGAKPRECEDPPTLRPPAIRGMLRFWSRALGGGSRPDLESTLWGSTQVGQGVSLRVPVVALNLEREALFPHKDEAYVRAHEGEFRRQLDRFNNNFSRVASEAQSVTQRIGLGSIITLHFRIPNPSLLPQIQAVVWTWLHLGSLGRRARRGYGSLLWHRQPEDLLDGFLNEQFDPPSDLEDPPTLERYLGSGLAVVRSHLGVPDSVALRASGDWFQLGTVDQIFVGRIQPSVYTGMRGDMEDRIHGLRVGSRHTGRSQRNQMGFVERQERLASPMMWRLFPVEGDTRKGYIPVMTWAPREGVVAIDRACGMYRYLNGTLGFDRSLAGNPLGR